ncbi:hypothetical protein WKY82_09175 [Gordonia malaquae]|uniref:hypothetical protein n=1 Tax=Gordonia malaquae TaxID=410332 RepID=UPI0030C7909F
MIDTDDPQHWPGDSGAVIEATSDERAARYVNTWFDSVLSWTLINRDDINLPLFTADDIRALLIAEPYTAVSTRQYPDYTYVSQLP